MNNPVIRANNFCFRYKDGREALRGVDLTINAGEKVCLAGPNGAGKSTLLLCLAGLQKGRGIAQVNAPLGLVFQDPEDQLFCPTVGEDVAFGPRNQNLSEEEIAWRVADSLCAVGLSGFELRNALQLSGGEKRRAAIASVLSCAPAILALDEPWANLDARASQAVIDILNRYAGTLLVVSQDIYHAAEVCDRLVILDEGRIIADGPMQELIADASLLEAHGLTIRSKCRFCYK